MRTLTIDASLAGGLTTNSGALTYVAGMSVGSLNSTASGAVTETGAITVTGPTTINAGGNAITLTSANDFQGTVSLTGGATQITDGNALTLGTVNTGSLTTINTGALDLGTGTINGALDSTTNNGDITQTGAIVVTGTTDLQAGTGSITLPASNDFQGVVTADGTGGITIVDTTGLSLGALDAGAGVVDLTAASLLGAGFVTAGSGTFVSDTNVVGLGITIAGNLHMDGAATLYNYSVGSSAGSFSVSNANISVQISGATFVASVIQQQAAAVIGNVSEQIGAIIVEEANKTFGTDSVAEDVEYGFAGEIGATPPMDHRIDETGISLPSCVQEAREGEPCK
jgi:hypothetical protein